MPEPRTAREWGDGATSTAEHVIAGISFVEGWTLCRCGDRVTAASSAALKQAWDIHRGLIHATLEHFDPSELADDIEVEEFFALHLDRTPLTPGVVLRQEAQEVQHEW